MSDTQPDGTLANADLGPSQWKLCATHGCNRVHESWEHCCSRCRKGLGNHSADCAQRQQDARMFQARRRSLR